MTPAQHGYVRCHRCGVWRRQKDTQQVEVVLDEMTAKLAQCAADAVCSRMADAGKGELEGAEA